MVCATGSSCVAGACACQMGLSSCSDSCRDLSSDGANCGACGKACGPGLLCSLGACAQSCAAGLTQCTQDCVQLDTNSVHCGACNTTCGPGLSCSSGHCGCTPGSTCGGSAGGGGDGAGGSSSSTGASGAGGSSSLGGNAGAGANTDPGVFWDSKGGFGSGHPIGVYPSDVGMPDVANVSGLLTVNAHADLTTTFFSFDTATKTYDFTGYTTLQIVYRSTNTVHAYLVWGADPGSNWAVVGTGANSYVVPYWPGHDGGAQEIVLAPSQDFATKTVVVAAGVNLALTRTLSFTSMANGTKLEFQSIVLDRRPIVEQLGRFEPARGHTYVIAGEYSAGVQDYVSTIGTPAGIMYYLTTNWETGWSQSGDGGTLAFQTQSYAGTFLQMGLFLDAQSCSYIQSQQSGDSNPYLDDLAGKIKASKRPVFLRIGYEFDNAAAGHGCGGNSDQYKAVYQQVANQLRNVRQVQNVAFVWHTAGDEQLTTQAELAQWYPGDTFVDWLGISVFGYSFEFKINPMNELNTFAEAKNKPIMIAESSVTAAGGAGWDVWNDWFYPIDYYARHHDRLKAWSFIHENWTGKFGFTFDARFNGGLSSVSASWKALLAEPRYLEAKDLTLGADGTTIGVQ